MHPHISRRHALFSIPFSLSAFAVVTAVGCFDRDNATEVPAAVVNADFPSAASLNAKLGRGINFGNALDAPHEGAWGVTLQPEWFQWIADSGFATVRIPVSWSTHSQSVPPYAIDSAFMARVVWAVDRALAAKLNVIIDMHHYDSLTAEPEAERPRFLAMWRQIASRFAGYPPQLLLEILNEPSGKVDAATWNSLLNQAIDTIRAIQPRRTLIVGTTPWGGLSGLADLDLPADSNIIVTVHYYEPFRFTHQGAAFYPGADAWLGTLWRATPAERAQADDDIKIIRTWAEAHHRPIFLGEFGTYEKVDSVSRALYTEYLTTHFSQAGFSWALWNFGSDFGVWVDGSKTWHGGLMQAMLRPGHNAYLDSILNATQKLDLGKYLVFDDFEDSLKDIPTSSSDWQAKLGRPLPQAPSHYYTFYSESSLVTDPAGTRLLRYNEVGPDKAPSNFGLAQGPWGFQSQGLHVKMKLAGGNYPFAGFGAGLFAGWDSSFTDLTNMTAVQFRAKGRGEWNLQIVSDSAYNKAPPDSNWGQMYVHFILTDQWETYVFPADFFVPKKYSKQEADKLTWEAVRDKIIALEFMNGQSYGEKPNDSLEIWIDDIRIVGVEKKNFGL